MTIYALVQGSLFRPAEARISKNGRAFLSAMVRTKESESSQFIKLFAFSDHTRDELSRLQDGDALSVQGNLSVETYIAVSGATKVDLSIVAEQILPLRAPPKTRATKSKPSPCAQEHDRAFDDSIPF
jgi:single-stranded DNA-binding protein